MFLSKKSTIYSLEGDMLEAASQLKIWAEVWAQQGSCGKNGAPARVPGIPWHREAPLKGRALQCCTAMLAADKTTDARDLATSGKVLWCVPNWISHWIFHMCTHKAYWWFCETEILLIWQRFPLLPTQFCLHCSKNNSHSHSKSQMFLSALYLAEMDLSHKSTEK